MGFLHKKDRSRSEHSPAPSSTVATKIKVIKFKEATENYPIKVKTYTIDTSETKFSALTYCEDLDQNQSKNDSISANTIMCDNTPLRVDKSLYDALEQVKEVGSDLPIWADKLCIDIRNPVERAIQTNYRGDIFGKAAHIVIWLGRKPPYANDTVLTMRKLVNAIDWRKIPPDSRYDFRDPRLYHYLNIEPVSMQQWDNIFALCNAKWFSRLWTFYELVNAKNAMFLYGDSRIDFQFMTDFSKVIELTGWADSVAAANGDWSQQQHLGLTRMFSLVTDYRAVPVWHPKHPEHLAWMQQEYGLDTESQRAWKFFEFLIQTTEDFQCQDQRDKIFAPLALVRKGFRGRPVDKEWPLVDYTIPNEGVYTNFANLISKITGVPSIIASSLLEQQPAQLNRQNSTNRPLPKRKPIDTM